MCIIHFCEIEYCLIPYSKGKEGDIMDSLKRIQPEDPTKINVNQDWEVKYWCNKFNCTESELRNAVKVAGTSVEAVKGYLK